MLLISNKDSPVKQSIQGKGANQWPATQSNEIQNKKPIAYPFEFDHSPTA